MSLVRFRNQAFCLKRQNGVLAQSVEHLTFNQVVRGSESPMPHDSRKALLIVSSAFLLLKNGYTTAFMSKVAKRIVNVRFTDIEKGGWKFEEK